MNNTELLPCPFCGNTEPKLVPQGNAPEAFVYCGKCDLTANLTETAIKKWNTRADKAAPVESDDLQNAVNCLKAAIDVVKIGAVPNIDLLYVVEEILSQPKQSAPVERIDGLAEALACLDDDSPQYTYNLIVQFKEKYKCMPNVKFQEAARAYLKLQGGE